MKARKRNDAVRSRLAWRDFARPIPLGECLEHCDRFVLLVFGCLNAGEPLDDLHLCQGRNHTIKHCWVEIDGEVYDCCSLNLAEPYWGVPAKAYYEVGGFHTVRRFTWDEVEERMKRSDRKVTFWLDD